jgi:hypothetical protein
MHNYSGLKCTTTKFYAQKVCGNNKFRGTKIATRTKRQKKSECTCQNSEMFNLGPSKDNIFGRRQEQNATCYQAAVQHNFYLC